jgi:hypothetical protein
LDFVELDSLVQMTANVEKRIQLLTGVN